MQTHTRPSIVGRLRGLLLALALVLAPLLGLAPAASAAVRPGTVVAWGRDDFGRVSGRPTDANYIAIAGGSGHSLALRSDGTVVAWGGDDFGQVSGRPTDANYIAIAAGSYHSLALRRDGTVVAWGHDDYGQVSQRPTDAGYIAIAAGYADNLALKRDGTVVTWGRNSNGSQTVPPGLNNVVAIARGNDHSLVLVSRDSTPPVIAPDVSGTLTNGWYSSDVQLSWNVSDDESAIASTSGCDPQAITSDTAGVSFTCSASSAGGSASQSVTIQRDATAPTVSVTGVSNGASYPLGSVPAAGCTTSDELSKVATEATPSIKGGNADGSGSFTATCAGATDNAGNSGSASVSYSVAYRWSGFLQPVDNLPTLNSVKAGSAVPAKFSLGGNYGLNILAQGYPKLQQVACSGSAPVDEVEQTVTASASGLSYDAASGQYSYTWKTDKAWAGTCRQLVLKLVDGSEHIAGFQFK